MGAYIIAEAGVNHNGSPEIAYKLIDAAAEAGANAVKFQTFKTDRLVARDTQKANYQIKATGDNESASDMLKKLELDDNTFIGLAKHAKKLNIDFLSTAFDDISLDFLINRLALKTLKIASGELTNAPLVLAHARTKSNLIVSTGMATLSEIKQALEVISYGFIEKIVDFSPSRDKFREAYLSTEAQKLLKEKVTILHCTTEYPAPFDEINLSALQTIKEEFNLDVGYSDHTEGIHIPPIAIAFGAKVIEKHFTLDRNMTGPDHKASLEPQELKNMINLVKTVEKSIGNGIKAPSSSEIANTVIVRKSIHADKDIHKDEEFTKDNLSIKRPANGMSPYLYWELIGKKSSKNYKSGEVIDE